MTIVIYPETDLKAGLGHLTRCVALGESLAAKQSEVVFVCRSENTQALGYLHALGWPTWILPGPNSAEADLAELELRASESGRIDWLVVDSYQVDDQWLQRARNFIHRLAVIDDLANRFFGCDLLLNQNLGFDEAYAHLVPETTQLLVGPQFALLRREFTEARIKSLRVRSGSVERILVVMGGADFDDCTGKAVQAILSLDRSDLRLDIVVNSGYQFVDRLKRSLASSNRKAAVHQAIVAQEMVELMQAADLCIGAAGSASWERCCLGLPAVLFVLADNQLRVAEQLERYGAGVSLGWHADVSIEDVAAAINKLIKDAAHLKEMSMRAEALVDGMGSDRVSDALCQASGAEDKNGKRLSLRIATENDCRLLLGWVNDPATREASFLSHSISWQEHSTWFALKLKDKNCRQFIAVDNEGVPIGQVRFDISAGGEAEIDVSIDRGMRGLGYGPLLIASGVEEIFKVTAVPVIHAFIKPGNKASIRAFEKAGFTRQGVRDIIGSKALHYSIARR